MLNELIQEVAKRLGSPSLPLDHVRWEDVAFFNLYFPIYTESFTVKLE